MNGGIEQKEPTPSGVLPARLQTWILLGLATVMVLVMWLSPSAPPKNKAQVPMKPAATIDTNQVRIQEYRARLDEEVKKMMSEQAELKQMKESFNRSDAQPYPSGPTEPVAARVLNPYLDGSMSREKPPVIDEQRNREYLSRFASNIVDLSAQPKLEGPASATSSQANPVGSLIHTRTPVEDLESELTIAEGKNYRIFEGTVLETVLTNRLDGSFSGPVNCMLTTAVYSHDRNLLLIPAGSHVLGEVSKVESFGQQRLAVTFHRLIMPDGFSVSLDEFKGLNQVGETGLRDRVNHHYAQVFGISLAIGSIAGLTQINSRSGLEMSGADAYRQGVAASLSQNSLHILDRYLNILPTFTIREGHRVKVYLAGDILLPAYDKHRLPSDL